MGTLRLRIRQALSADKLPPSSGIVVPRVPYMPSFPECPHTVVTMQRLAISRPSGSRLFSTDVTKMARALPNDVSNNDIGNILIKLIDETATPFDIATLFATAPGAVVSVLKIYFDNILQDNPDNTVMNLLHQPRVPADARIALALLYTSAQVDHDALDGELTAAIRESSVAEPSMALSGKQVEVDLHQLTAKIRALFRRFMPEADRILALVDVHQQRHAQDITAMTAPIDIPTLKPIVMGRRSLTPDVSLSLLFHGGELASWFKMLIGRNITRDSQRPQTVMVGLLGNIAFTGNQLGMIIDLIKTSGLLALDIEQIVLPHVRSNPTLAEKLLRSLYVANKPMGEYVLAEYERRYNLPEARVDRAMAAAFSEGKQQRHWRKAATVGAAEMEATVKRALLFADTGDEAQLRVVASRFIGAVIDNFRELRSDLQAFGPEQDPSGYHVFTILNTKTYDSSKNPLGFLLPHELAFWEQGFSNAHPTVEYIRKMMRVVSNGDFRELYSFFLEKRSFDDGMRFIHKAAHGEIPGVDANAVHELMRGAVLNPGQHAALLLWATSEPSQPNKRDAWAGMPLQAVRVLNYAQSRRATIAGNIVELILRSEQYDARAELNAVQYYARTNGNWVHILPIDYSNRRKIADLLVISKDGSMQLVEVKNKLLYNPQVLRILMPL